MSKQGAVPDAWDDDWVKVADKREAPAGPTPAPKLTKSEKRAQHQQLQKQLWDTAENPARNHWLETQGVVPLKQELRPQVKLLSRKPQIAPQDAANGVAGLNIDDGEDSEEEVRKKRETEFEERQRKAKIDREEKQRKYAEARERIMGSSTPTTNSRESSQGRDHRKPRGRPNSNRNSQPASASQSPTRAAQFTADGSLFDANDMGRRIPKPNTPTLDGPTRQPRAPPSDHTSRGGFGFPGRGGKAAA